MTGATWHERSSPLQQGGDTRRRRRSKTFFSFNVAKHHLWSPLTWQDERVERGLFVCPFLLVLLLFILLLDLRHPACLLMQLSALLLLRRLLLFLLLWSRRPVSLGHRPVLPPPLPVGAHAVLSQGPALFWADPGSDQPLPLWEKKSKEK